MNDFGRQLLTVVEIDVRTCAHKYGLGPCKAALGTTGDRKCYNTRGTCQFHAAFGTPSEGDVAATGTYAQGDTITSTDYDWTARFLWACDLSFGISPSGIIFEIGGASWNSSAHVTGPDLVVRSGNGGAPPQSDLARLAVPVADYIGKTGTLYGVTDVAASSVTAWWWDGKTLSEIGTATAATPFPQWGGANAGGVGVVGGFVGPGGEDNSNFSGTISAFRGYSDSSATPTHTPHTTLRFANDSGAPIYPVALPLLRSVSSSPTAINVGGASDRVGALGKRARVKIQLDEMIGGQRYLDPYYQERKTGAAQVDEGGFDPDARGTFWRTLRTRWPHYSGASVRVKTGLKGQSYDDMFTRSYVLSEWSGPDASGRVSLTAKDILDLADDKKALCPRPSNGRLAADITDVFVGDITLTPPTVGEEYASQGRISIGQEIMTYQRSGDVLTIIERGVDGSERSNHARLDVVQECAHWERGKVQDVLLDILQNYTSIPADLMPYAAWAEEADRWLLTTQFTATITKPTGVASLLEELTNHGFLIWWDEQSQLIQMRANRPVGKSVTPKTLSEANGIIANSEQIKNLESHRMSNVIFYHGTIDATQGTSKGNFRRAFSTTLGDDFYDQPSIKEIRSRWLGDGSEITAGLTSIRLLQRFKETPREIVFDIDRKDIVGLGPASYIMVESRFLTDDTGKPAPTPCVVVSVEETQPGHRAKVTAWTYNFTGNFGEFTENDRPDYDGSTPEQKDLGTYFSDGENNFPDGRGPYTFI